MRVIVSTNKPKIKKNNKKVIAKKEYLSADELLERVIPKIEALFDKK